jgi:hypothetical protein
VLAARNVIYLLGTSSVIIIIIIETTYVLDNAASFSVNLKLTNRTLMLQEEIRRSFSLSVMAKKKHNKFNLKYNTTVSLSINKRSWKNTVIHKLNVQLY